MDATRIPSKTPYNIANLFSSDVVKWRQNASKLWSLTIILFFVYFHSVTANVNIITDFTALISGFFFNIFFLQFWLYSFLILTLFWILFLFYDRLYTVSPKIYANNFERISQIFYSIHLPCIISNFVSTLLISSVLLNFYDPNNSNKINYFYVISFCGFSNLLNKFQFSFYGNYLLRWPIIEQTKYIRFKSRVYSTILKTLKRNLIHLFLWQIIYSLIGFPIKRIFLGNDDHNLNPLFSFTTVLVALKISLIINLINSFSWSLYEIYLTQIYHFDIQPRLASQIDLSTAMSLNSHPYIQTLALIDFSDLSIYSESRRKQFFTLSYANGQPVNWNKACNAALNSIFGFMEIFNFDDMIHGSEKFYSSRFSSRNITSPIRDASKYVTSPITSPLRTKMGLSDQIKSPSRESTKITNTTPVQMFFMSISEKIINKLKRHRLFSYIYNENPNYKTHQMFVDSFLITNVLRGLSNIAVASLNEDEYGILQQTLADIITAFIQLQKVLEKFNPTCGTPNISFKVLQKSNANEVELLIQKLTFVLNESIYKIALTFGGSLKSLNLTDEVFKRLQKYYLLQ